MKSYTLVVRSLLFYRRTHLGVLAGAAVATAVLTGAMLIGDSVRHTLRRFALLRVGRTQVAIDAGERFFRTELADELTGELHATTAPVLSLKGTGGVPDGSVRAGLVQVLGVDGRFWRLGGSNASTDTGDGMVVLNEPLADLLGVAPGETILLRIEKPSLSGRETPLSKDADARVAVRLKISAVVGEDRFGRFSLEANQISPLTAFLPLSHLQRLTGLSGRANLLLVGGQRGLTVDTAQSALRKHWKLRDAQLTLRELPEADTIELRSDRIFIDAVVTEAAAAAFPNAQGVLTYFVNELRAGPRLTPYSMVSAIGPLTGPEASPSARLLVPPKMKEGEIIISEWLASDLRISPDDELEIEYFVIGPMRKLITRTAAFKVRTVTPLSAAGIDATLAPDFPGLTRIENCRNWHPGIPIDLKRIRPIDERYWREHRGTPKALVTLKAGRKMWANRFGNLTSVRFPRSNGSQVQIAEAIRGRLDPGEFGLFFRPIRTHGLTAGEQAMDFAQLFAALSFFLIVAAVLLTGLLFVFAVQQRTEQIGALLGMGFSPRRVRWVLGMEGGVLAIAGAAVGVIVGIFYTRAMLHALGTVWPVAVGRSAIQYHSDPLTLLRAGTGGALVALGAMWATLWRLTRRSAKELLGGEAMSELKLFPETASERRVWFWVGVAGSVAAVVVTITAAAAQRPQPGAFFAAGALLLGGSIAFCGAILTEPGRSPAAPLTLGRLGLSNSRRRRGRSLAVVALLALGTFVLISVSVFRLGSPPDPYARGSGTGGFALFGTTAIPLFRDLNTPTAQAALGMEESEMEGVRVLAMRIRDGDDASCLNLNRPQRPRLLGVSTDELQLRGAFTFVSVRRPMETENPWAILDVLPDEQTVPAIGDEATVVWGLGKGLGETIDSVDDRGRPFRLQVVGVIANSVLQGNLLISQEQFVLRFPSHSGYRAFLIDAPPDRARQALRTFSTALQDEGGEFTLAAERLMRFNTVQNTYLAIFQVLGGLGLLVGSVAMGVVVMRNILERRGELALLRAVGYTGGQVRRLILLEHWGLLAGGLICGVAAAAVAVLPILHTGGAGVPWVLLSLTLAAVGLGGAVWVALGTFLGLRGSLIEALGNE